MTRSSKHKRAKKASSRKEDEAVEEKATDDTQPEETVAKGDANPQPDEEAVVAVANEPPDEEKEKEEVADEPNDEEKDESSSKKRRLEEEEDDGFMNWGKMAMEWTAPVVHTLGSFWNSIVGGGGAPPAEPAEGPPAIDAVIPMMVVGDVRVLQTSALLDAVGPVESSSNGRTVEEYKKDFAFETRVGETKTIHSVRLQLYDCYGVVPADDSVKEDSSSAAFAAVQTIVLALSITQQTEEEEWKEALKTWTTWIRQQFPEHAKIVLLWTLEDDATEWPWEATVITELCQTRGIESWHVLSSDSSLPHAVSSIDDFLHSLVRSSQHGKPQGDDEAKKPSPKRRKVTREEE